MDEYGAPVRRRYQRGDQVRELAVLVGDFTSIDDPDAQQTLGRIKTLQPDALNVDASKTAQSMAQVRRFEDALLEKLGKTASAARWRRRFSRAIRCCRANTSFPRASTRSWPK